MTAIPLMKGTLDLLLLKALTWTPMHGVELTTWLEQRSGGELSFDDSGIYQALYRMEERGLISAEWGVSDHNRRARYYKITAKGRTHLEAETQQLVRYGELVTGILTAPTKARA
ncbi:MAG TPA: PadR family transcriptional regulator [Thermoanaerobaculia bacterium]|jgi:transcriptional regulator|nr:PadR family transcriptional regulator [Thermoanaerobaculia bacterium]